MSPNAGRGGGELQGFQSMSTAVRRSPKKLWRSNSIFNLWLHLTTSLLEANAYKADRFLLFGGGASSAHDNEGEIGVFFLL
jgi:hypothetical protein